MNLKPITNNKELNSIEREIRVHFTLKHPHIIKLYDCLIEKELVYMIMEWAENGNVYSHLFKKGYLNENESFKYFL